MAPDATERSSRSSVGAVREPIADTPFTIQRRPPAAGASLRRSRLACESSVRVDPINLKPQTSRRSSFW